MITEVQITFIVLMGLITLSLIFSLSRYTAAGKVLDFARKLLAGGTSLITVHFVLQYILHKEGDNVEDIRTMANMLFGIPITYLFNISYLYIQRKGNIQKTEWLYGPATFLLTLCIFLFSVFGNNKQATIPFANQITALIYASVLIYYPVLIAREYHRIQQDIKEGKDLSHISLIKWTQWSMFSLVVIGLGFPIMTFNSNLLARAFYGILAISSSFFYILSFIGYSLNFGFQKMQLSNNEPVEQNRDKKHPLSDDSKIEHIISAAEEFIRSGYYLQAGITLKDVAVEMGISCNMLKVWLHSTPYEKFNNWITHLRIEKAKEFLLENPNLTSEEIAEQCGFCDRQYFQQLFKKQEGISPSKWIKEKQFPELQEKKEEPSPSK